MTSKLQKPIRVFGQRSIDSTLHRLPSKPSDNSKGDVVKQTSPNGTRVSLSDFLDRKLQKSSVVPGTIQGKSTPFLSPLGLGGARDGLAGTIKRVEETKSISDRVIFERFKHIDEEKGDFIGPTDGSETENSVTNANGMQDRRKRKNPFEGPENHTVQKHVVVLGGESKRRQKGRTIHSSSNKKLRPPYNHYANGCGWWDCDMEGVDNEEVGFNEVLWEGVGSTSLGEIVDWH